jgi:predicted TIM-barrel fold metal-dependent hydrolase
MESKTQQKITYTIHNVHVHLFTIDYIPRYFLHSKIPVSIVKNKSVAKWAYRLFRNTINRYSAFFYSGLKQTQAEIFEELQSYYPEKTKFVPLTVDFDYMEAGPCAMSFKKQLEDMAKLKKNFPENIFPFIGVDPRRKDIFELVRHYIENEEFSGIKIYPALGFFPFDERLYPVYEYAQKHELPITAHCIPKNKNHYRGKISGKMIQQAKSIEGVAGKIETENYDFAQYFNHPNSWKKVLEIFPKLKINLAHFGGDEEWNKYLDNPARKVGNPENWYALIRNLMKDERFPNVYADISFTVYDQRLYPVLKNLVKDTRTQDFVLFGSDFYMLQKDYRERRFGLDVRGYLDDEDYWQIAEVNPRRFLTSKIRDDFSPVVF